MPSTAEPTLRAESTLIPIPALRDCRASSLASAAPGAA